MRLCGAVACLLMITGGWGGGRWRTASPEKCYFRGSPAGPVSEGSADICASPRRPAVCFSSVGKPKPVGFVFLLLLAECLLLKPRCQRAESRLSEKHAMESRVGGRSRQGGGVGGALLTAAFIFLPFQTG